MKEHGFPTSPLHWMLQSGPVKPTLQEQVASGRQSPFLEHGLSHPPGHSSSQLSPVQPVLQTQVPSPIQPDWTVPCSHLEQLSRIRLIACSTSAAVAASGQEEPSVGDPRCSLMELASSAAERPEVSAQIVVLGARQVRRQQVRRGENKRG